MKPLFILLITCIITVDTKAQVPNDSCTNAENIPNLGTLQSIAIDLNNVSESLDASCETASNTNLDLWYSFIMPFDGKIKLSGLSVVNKISLYESCGGTELLCMGGNGFMETLSGGRSYLLRYGTASQFAGRNTMYIQAFAPPANDDCVNAISITNITTQQSVLLDNRGADESLDVSCENAADQNFDIWYSFTMPFDGKVKFTGLSVSHKLGLYTTCSGNELDCRAGNGFFENLTGGTSYLLRYGSLSLSAGINTLYIQAFAPPINDFCTDAIALSNIQTRQTISLDTRGASESLDASCEDSANNNLDLWYSFTMPFDGKVEIAGVFGVNKLSLYNSCGGNEVACFANSGFFEGLIGGNAYFLRYAAISQQALGDDISIQAFAQLQNDFCTDAILLSNIETSQSISLDNRGANESLDASCEDANNKNLDLWYAFSMPFDGKVEISGVFGVNKLALYDSCGGNEIDCFASNGFFDGLLVGNTYYLRYASIPQQAIADIISIQAFPSILNDDCSEAINISSIDSLQIISLDTRQANESLDASCELAANDNYDLWYSFTMPFNGQITLDGLTIVRRIVIYEACGGNEFSCLEGSGSLYGLSEHTNYLLRYSTPSTHAALDEFSIQAFAPSMHDECSTPVQISHIDTLQHIITDTREATQSLVASCEDSSFTQNDLWYKFTMPFSGKLVITEGNNAHNFSLWDSCGGNEISCFSGFGEFEGLKDSTEYRLRYASTISSARIDSFELQAVMSVGVEEFKELTLKLYPNPTKDWIQIEWEGRNNEKVKLSIIDLSGKEFLSQPEIRQRVGMNRLELNLKSLALGVYILRYEGSGITHYVKLAKN